MSIDKTIDSAQLDGALRATANAIRAKTGDSAQIAWDASAGFSSAVDAIPTGAMPNLDDVAFGELESPPARGYTDGQYYEAIAEAIIRRTEQGSEPKGGITVKLLWENASPQSTFAEQTISLDLSGYDFVAITFMSSTDEPENWKTQIFPANHGGVLTSSNSATGVSPPYYETNRSFTISETGITFGAGRYSYGTTQNNVDPMRCIPEKIYGIAGVQ